MSEKKGLLLTVIVVLAVLGLAFFWHGSTSLTKPVLMPLEVAELAQKAKDLVLEAKAYPEKVRILQEKIPEGLSKSGYFILQKAEFSGVNKKGDRWRIYADEAVQPKQGGGMYLDGVLANTAKKNKALSMEAAHGVFDEATSTLLLDQGFKGFFRDYIATGKNTKLFLTEQQAKGESLHVKGERGHLRAATFFADAATEKARFTNVQVRVFLKDRAI